MGCIYFETPGIWLRKEKDILEENEKVKNKKRKK